MPTRLSRIDQSLLERYPQWRGVVVMMIVLRDHGRSITGHDNELRRAVDGLVGRVNGRFGRSDYCPVQYVKRPLPHEQVRTRRGRVSRRTDRAASPQRSATASRVAAQIVALYSAADVNLVTSVREGINTCAMEFVACQGASREEGCAKEGVLVYSEVTSADRSRREGKPPRAARQIELRVDLPREDGSSD